MKRNRKIAVFSLALLGTFLPLTSCGEPITEVIDPKKTIEINTADTTLLGGEELNVDYKVTNGTDTTKVTFSSSNTKIATVDQSGKVTANNIDGSCLISVTLDGDVSVYATLKIKTKSRIRVKSIACSSSDMYLSKDGGQIDFEYAVSPTNSDNKAVDISISDTSIATLSENKKSVIAKKTGTAELVIKSLETFSKVEKRVPITVNEEGYVTLEKETEPMTKYINYQDVLNTTNEGGLNGVDPKDGKNKVLVLPIEFTDYTYDRVYDSEDGEAKIKKDLNILFNGKSEETNYWESVSSYFKKSSFGNLNFEFTIADVYSKNKKAGEAVNESQSGKGVDQVHDLVNEALGDYKTKNSTKLTEFDQDSNGNIDAVWAVYSNPSYNHNTTLSDAFWAFTSWGDSTKVVGEPTMNRFAWASFDFMINKGRDKYDAHTFIHETGHLFGLDDYYDYSGFYPNAPLGCLDMQDFNVGDHNAWTKLALGWEKPYIYEYSNKENRAAKVHLNPAATSGDSLVIANNYNGTAFDEYIVVELYTNEGLNEHDSKEAYSSADRDLLPSTYGIKMYHVDARLVTKPSTTNGEAQVYYDTSKVKDVVDGNLGESPIRVGASNTYGSYPRNNTDEGFDLITMITSKQERATFYSEQVPYTSADFFMSGSSFNLEKNYINYYQKTGLLNSGESLNVKVTFDSVTKEGADITIEPYR